jgi:hypothetical protein
MNRKTEQIRAARAAGDRIGACVLLRASSTDPWMRRLFKRGMDAFNNPSFYRQLGMTPNS